MSQSVSPVPHVCPFARAERRQVKVITIDQPAQTSVVQGRRDYYKIVLVTGHVTIHYGGQSQTVDGSFLFFANPHTAHTVIDLGAGRQGYGCLFTEPFMAGHEQADLLQRSALVRTDRAPLLQLTPDQATYLTGLFRAMLAAQQDAYAYRNELIRNALMLVLHEAERLQPVTVVLPRTAAARITNLFLERLEAQFPIESPADPLQLRAPQDFARALSVHVNYLNRSVKELTGKPTSVHIAERIAAEARALLQHTTWSIADIAYGLGFDYPTYFDNHFKRLTGQTPTVFRRSQV